MNKKIYFLISLVWFQFGIAQEALEELGIINSNSEHCSPTFKAIENTLFFDAGSGLANGVEPWSCNTETGATALFQNINSGFSSSNPYFIASINNKLLFSADDGLHGLELWITDGTLAGTQLVKDINTGTGAGMLAYNCAGSGPVFNDPKNYGVLNNKLFFEGFTNNGEQLWISDGTTAGTILLKQIDTNAIFNGNVNFIQNFTVVGNKLFFTAVTNSALNRELWVTDGTTSGTFLVKDIYVGDSSSNPLNLIAFNNKLLFTANDGTHGIELWSSDGTTGGTTMVSDINLGGSGSNPSGFYAFNNQLFFLANDGIAGNELWVYTTSGSVALVKDTQPGATGILYIHNQTAFNAEMYFMTADQLWKTDGTQPGTSLVKGNLVLNSNSTKMLVYNNKLYFGSNYLLWSSDGTPTGTIAFPELPNTSFTNVQPFTDINGKLIIVPNISNYGTINNRFWTCDSNENITLIDASTTTSYGTVFKFNDALYFEGTNSSYKLFRYGLPLNLGNESHLQNLFKVYPNPTTHLVTIQSEKGFFTETKVIVTNILGQLVLENKNSQTHKISLDLSTQPTGLYWVTIEEEGNKKTLKIVKE
ncbi:MAG: T9SS type A sorting domain-containing protein [Flavobacterium sp.]|nr:T9SS type A sorting domain-containing protein [Flavobacterium sp.]